MSSHKPKESPLASIKGPKEEFKFKLSELRTVLFDTNVLSDFSGVDSLIILRKLFKNASFIKEAIEVISTQEVLLLKKRQEADSYIRLEDHTEEDKIKVKEAYEEEDKKFYDELHPIELFTVSIDSFPTDVKLFGEKQFYLQNGQEKPVKYVSSFLSLIEFGIIKEEE